MDRRPAMTAAALAEEAHRLIGVAPRRALRLADEAVQAAATTHDLTSKAQALRARGRAQRELGDLDEALRSLRQAVRIAEAGQSATVASQSRMTLAYVLLERGHTARALRHAIAAAEGLRGLEAAHALMQVGLVYQRCGKAAEALDCYRRSIPVLRRARDRLHEAKAHNNRGLLHLYQGRLTEAASDIRLAASIYADLGQDVHAADTEWNLGLVAGRQGDIPRALRLFDGCEATFAAHGIPAPELLVHRAELLLAAGLRGEARQVVARAMTELTSAGLPVMLAEAKLLSAQAALADGDTTTGAEHAAHAAQLFGRQRRPGWSALARYVQLRAEESQGQLTPALRRRALRCARDLAQLGWRPQELDARVIAARVALEQGAVRQAARELAAVRQVRSGGPLELRMRAWHAEALLRLAQDDRRGARRALAAGMRVLDQHRAMVGTAELRVHLASYGRELTELGIRLAREAGSAQQLLAWTERGRARGLWPQPIRPPRDPALASLLADFRRTTVELESAMLGAAHGLALRREATVSRSRQLRLAAERDELEEQIRRRVRASTAGLYGAPPSPPRPAELEAVLGERALVEIVASDSLLHAVVVADGVTRLRPLGEPAAVSRLSQSLLFALRRLTLGHGGSAARERAWWDAERHARRLAEELLEPAAELVAGRPLVLVPPAQLQSLPWSLLPGFWDQRVTVAPSAALWLHAATKPDRDRDRVVLAAGPGLRGADAEIADITGVYPHCDRLTGARATVSRTLASLDGASVGHIAAHGRVHSDNPLFSALELSDGPLTVYDLEQLTAPPELVLLPACQSGVGHALAGDEVMGWTAALMALGTRTVIAAVVPVPDSETRQVMVALHRRLRAGDSPAQALRAARTASAGTALQRATAAAFVCFGAG